MEAQKYLKIAIAAVIGIVVLVVGYGIYINEESRRHIDKMEASQYTVLPVAYADYRDLHAVISDVNITVSAPWTVDSTAQYEGVLEEILVARKQRVEAGTLLATMKNNDLLAQIASAEADIEGARAKLINAEQTVERYKYLVEHNAIAVSEYDSAIAQRDAARAQFDNKTAQRDLVRSEENKMLITAPSEANIVQIYRGAGKYVRAGEALFMLADIRHLKAFSIIPHDKLERLLSVGGPFILEIQPYRLINKAYPLNDTLPKTSLKLNQFALAMSSAVPAGPSVKPVSPCRTRTPTPNSTKLHGRWRIPPDCWSRPITTAQRLCRRIPCGCWPCRSAPSTRTRRTEAFSSTPSTRSRVSSGGTCSAESGAGNWWKSPTALPKGSRSSSPIRPIMRQA